jgi:hypothetical protein
MKHENLFKIYIPEPCHEEWNKMTPNKQGAFCKVCTKTVVDFSGKTDAEIQQYLHDNIDKKICGRFKVTQIEAPKPEETPRLKIQKPKFEFPGFLIPVLTPFRACAMSLMIFASAALMSCGNSGGGAGDDERLAGTIALVDSVETPRMLGEIEPMKNDSTCKIDDDDNIKVGKIKVIENNDSLKTDTTETMIKGDVEPIRKMGELKVIEPEKEKEYFQGLLIEEK